MKFIHLLSGKEWGETERFSLELSKAMRADGFDVAVVTRAQPDVFNPFAAEGLHAGCQAMRGPLGMFITPVNLAGYINKNDADKRSVIIIHDFKDAQLAINTRKLAKKPENIKIFAQVLDSIASRIPASQLKAFNELDGFILPSQAALKNFLTSSPETDRRRLVVIPPCSPHAPSADDKPDGAVQIIYIGKIEKYKGLDVLINSLAEIKDLDWRLTIWGVGKGRDVMPLVRSARSLGLNGLIDWKGKIVNPGEEFQKAHIAVFPSICEEASALTALEALSRGCAVVASDIGALSEALKNGENALLTKPNDVNALAIVLRNLIKNDDFRKEIAQNGKNLIEHNFSYPKFFEETMNFLKNYPNKQND